MSTLPRRIARVVLWLPPVCAIPLPSVAPKAFGAVDEKNPIDAALARFTDPDHQQRYHDRGMIVETVFAFLRHILGYRRWMVRGKERVAAEGTLFKTAYQFRKVHCAWKFASAA